MLSPKGTYPGLADSTRAHPKPNRTWPDFTHPCCCASPREPLHPLKVMCRAQTRSHAKRLVTATHGSGQGTGAWHQPSLHGATDAPQHPQGQLRPSHKFSIQESLEQQAPHPSQPRGGSMAPACSWGAGGESPQVLTSCCTTHVSCSSCHGSPDRHGVLGPCASRHARTD